LRMIYDARAALRFRRGREPLPEELARATGLTLEEVTRLLAMGRQSVSLEQPATADTERPLSDVLAVDAQTGPGDVLLPSDQAGRPRRVVAGLAVRERVVLVLRYGLEGTSPLTLREVGRRLGISRERVRQIEHRALLHLRRLLKS